MAQENGQSHKTIEVAAATCKKPKNSLLNLFFLLIIILCSLFYAPRFLITSNSLLDLYTPPPTQPIISVHSNNNGNYNKLTSSDLQSPFIALQNHTICCDRTSRHTDVCFMVGDVRTHSQSSSILLFPPASLTNANTTVEEQQQEERIKPYTRKWEGTIMDRIDELRLRVASPEEAADHQCDVLHDVPAVFFSAAGYTGNTFHAFNNVILPLYITVQHLHGRVVLDVLKYREWWFSKYREILGSLSNYELIDFFGDTRTHCFPGAIVGLGFHDTLAVDPARLQDNKTILDFRELLSGAYEQPHRGAARRPNLVIMSRRGTREIENEGNVVQLAKKVGFNVEVMRPRDTMPLSTIYASLSACDVMIGVHGAALTHFLFMRPGAMFVQIVPLGIDDIARECFGDAAPKMGLQYEEYKVLPTESSLYGKYGEDDEIVTDPDRVKKNRGWEFTKQVYLEGQNVTLDLARVEEMLVRAFTYAALRRTSGTAS